MLKNRMRFVYNGRLVATLRRCATVKGLHFLLSQRPEAFPLKTILQENHRIHE